MPKPRKLINYQDGPESKIQKAVIVKLERLKWLVKITHGNLYQSGLPDLYCAHRMYGQRWVEIKDPSRRGDVFTVAQHEFFPQLAAAGVGVWILTSDDDYEIKKIHGPPNWHMYLQCMR